MAFCILIKKYPLSLNGKIGCDSVKIVFMGTPDFAVPTLKKCFEAHEVIAVFTQPDKPKGRGKKCLPPPVKEEALALGIPVYQPERIKQAQWVALLKELSPDVIVVIAYGQLLSKDILDIPRLGCINVHGSLLPQYRGAAPIQWAVIHGNAQTGITTMQMDVGLDTGDMLIKRAVPISPEDTSETMYETLAVVGAEALIDTLEGLEKKTLVAVKQDDALATYAPMLSKDMARINWSQDAKAIVSAIHGFNPWPIAHTVLEGQTLKVFKASVYMDACEGLQVGSAWCPDKKTLVVKAGDMGVKLEEIQWGSGKRMAASAFLLGHPIIKDTVLG